MKSEICNDFDKEGQISKPPLLIGVRIFYLNKECKTILLGKLFVAHTRRKLQREKVVLEEHQVKYANFRTPRCFIYNFEFTSEPGDRTAISEARFEKSVSNSTILEIFNFINFRLGDYASIKFFL